MTDPYKILGVSPTASDDEIKQAYRELVRKYHPDKYAGTDLAELATEKMKEINAAYEEIQNLRKDGGGNFSSENYRNDTDAGRQRYNYENNANSKYNYVRIRSLINEGNLDEAEVLLENVSAEDQDGQWHFLMGCVLLRRGYYIDAISHLDYACQLDPYNEEYRAIRDRLKNQAEREERNRPPETQEGCLGSGCNLCASLMCADCCCECMGGDLLRC